jgi:hypothetical protein
MANEGPDDRRGFARALGHPAALLILTAVLTGLLVPWITNRWAERDKQVEAHRVAAERELGVKSAMVNRIGTASAQFLSAIDVGVIDQKGAEAPAEYRALKTASLEIASQLAAYFPDSGPEQDWKDYTFSLRNIYLALTFPSGQPRSHWLHLLNKYLDKSPKASIGLCFTPKDKRFARDRRELTLAVQHKEEEIVHEIADSPTILTGTPAPDFTPPPKTFKKGQPGPCGKSRQ